MIADSESDSDHDHGPVQLEKRQIIPFTASAPCANRRRPAAGAVSPGPPTAVCRGGGPQAAAADTEAAARPARACTVTMAVTVALAASPVTSDAPMPSRIYQDFRKKVILFLNNAEQSRR